MSLLGAILDFLSMSGAPNAPGIGTGIFGSAGPGLAGGGPGGPGGPDGPGGGDGPNGGDGPPGPGGNGPPGPGDDGPPDPPPEDSDESDECE